MLRLVHPARKGQEGGDPPKRRRGPSPALFLTDEEWRHLRASLRNLRTAFGSWSCLADVMGVAKGSLIQAAQKPHRPSAALALRAAQAGGMLVEVVLGYRALNAAGRCPHCGTRIGDRPEKRAGGAR